MNNYSPTTTNSTKDVTTDVSFDRVLAGLDKRKVGGIGFEEYCKSHGLCRRCGNVKTHKRIVSLFGRNHKKHPKWETITVARVAAGENNDVEGGVPLPSANRNNEYGVYKGYCLATTCYTMDEVKRILGESESELESSMGDDNDNDTENGMIEKQRHRSRASQRLSLAKGMLKRPNRRFRSGRRGRQQQQVKTNPDTGSVVSGRNSVSVTSSNVSGVSHNTSNTGKRSILSGMSGLSGMSRYSFGIGGGRIKIKRRSRNKRSTSTSSDMSVVSCDMSALSSEVDQDTYSAVAAPRTSDSAAAVPSSSSSCISPLIQKQIDALVSEDDPCTILDIQNINLMQHGGVNLDAIVTAFSNSTHKTQLEAVLLQGCQINDDGMEKLATGLELLLSNNTTTTTTTVVVDNNNNKKQKKNTKKTSLLCPSSTTTRTRSSTVVGLKRLCLRHNKIGNRGIQALDFLFQSSTTLEELDLSDNCIGSKGAMSLFQSLGANKTGMLPLSILNLSQNEIWELGGIDTSETIHNHFLYTNTTLEVLNVDGNLLHDEGVEQLALAMKMNTQCTLKELYVGWNGIGDTGILAIANVLEMNHCSLRVLGVAENDCTDIGASALLSALSMNVSMKEISGLYHNRVTKKYIILAIKRLLHRGGSERGVTNNKVTMSVATTGVVSQLQQQQLQNDGTTTTIPSVTGDDNAVALNQYPFDGGGNSDRSLKMEQLVDTTTTTTITTTSKPIPAPATLSNDEDCSSNSEGLGSVDEEMNTSATTTSHVAATAATSTSTSTQEEEEEESKEEESRSRQTNSNSIVLQAIENWDWGTFGIDEIEDQYTEETMQEIQMQMTDIEEEHEEHGNGGGGGEGGGREIAIEEDQDSFIRNNIVEATTSLDLAMKLPIDRIVVFQSAPLAYFDRKSMQHHGLPLFDLEYEARCLKDTFVDSKEEEEIGDRTTNNNNIELVFENATQRNLSNFFAQSFSPIMHFSCSGNSDFITLENGFGYMQALSVDSLKKIVSTSNGTVKVVVISSCNSQYIADAFLTAGIPHVVSLHRATTFRDDGPIDFGRGFYNALRENKTLLEAYNIGLECISVSVAYKLLPEHADHNVKVFYQKPPPKMKKVPPSMDIAEPIILPQMPNQFVGREVDMYEILESLRVDDVIRIGGLPGSGKKSILSVLSRYILDRSKSFQIDDIYWFPPPPESPVVPDSMYGDFCQVMNSCIEAKDDEEYMEARERIMIEIEGKHNILIIDGRVFTNETSGEMLEQFLTYLLNECNIKIILITDTTDLKSKHSISEETAIYLNPLDFKSSVLLFGMECPFVSTDYDDLMIDTINEFQDCLVTQSMVNQVVVKKKHNTSLRQKSLYNFMGKGNPRDIINVATTCTKEDFFDLLRHAQTPEVSISNSNELQKNVNKWTALKEKAVKTKYYLRADDISKTLEELEALKDIYPSLEDLILKEADLKKKFSTLLKAKRYDDANFVKRKILSTKRTIISERSSANPENAQAAALDSIQNIQARMETMMILAESMDKSTSSIIFNNEEGGGGIDAITGATFQIPETGTTLTISSRNTLYEHDYLSSGSDTTTSGAAINTAKVVWTNEAVDLSTNETGEKLLAAGGSDLIHKICALDTVAATKWGPVKCATGDSVLLKDVQYVKGDTASRCCIVLAVPPQNENNVLPASTSITGEEGKQSEKFEPPGVDSLQYMDTGLRSTLRSIFRKIHSTTIDVEVVAIPTASSLYYQKKNEEYHADDDDIDLHQLRCLEITLKTVVEEIKRGTAAADTATKKINKLKTVLLVASSSLLGDNNENNSSSGSNYESNQLIKLALEMGLSMTA